jgi:hypothetical protein
VIGDKAPVHPAIQKLLGGSPKQRRADPEHQIQAELIRAARGTLLLEHPCLADLHAIPNGGKRGKAVAAKMKREGVLRGVPDLFLPAGMIGGCGLRMYHGLYLETKAPGGTLTREQREFMQRAADRGYACATYRSADEGIALLLLYLTGNWEQSAGMFR